MARMQFCSACGRQIKIKWASFLPVFCAACKSDFRFAPFVLFSFLTFALFLSFVIGRMTAPAKNLQFIGTPVEATAFLLPPGQDRPDNQSPTRTSPTAAEALITDCGAPTKAGHPCRRKVYGWAYCWQHRDKLGKKPLPKDAALLEKIQQAGIIIQ
ncbi:MAG: hypothetical protein AB1757_23165 [Acidobacteriota bacterium]